jgi:hypothetical protein
LATWIRTVFDLPAFSRSGLERAIARAAGAGFDGAAAGVWFVVVTLADRVARPAVPSSSRAWDQGPETRCSFCCRHGDSNHCSAVVTVVQHGRKRGVPGIFVTSSHFGDGSVPLP